MRVISIANFKGGTGKTVTATNFAAIMADMGKKVLLIDADPQHNATDFYLLPEEKEDVTTLYDVLTGVADPEWPYALTPAGREGLDILPADMDLLRLDLAAIADGSSEALRRMSDFIGTLRSDAAFDYVIVDCPPSFTAASVAALMESDDVILPTRVDAWSRAGVKELLDQMRSLGRQAKGAAFRVLITMADRTNLSRQGSGALRESGLNVFGIEIRSAVVVGESSYARKPLSEYAPRSAPAMDYRAAVKEYLREVEQDG